MLDFITLDIGHLENVILLNYATLPNVDTGNFITQYKIAYYYTISKKKSHILISPPISFSSYIIVRIIGWIFLKKSCVDRFICIYEFRSGYKIFVTKKDIGATMVETDCPF